MEEVVVVLCTSYNYIYRPAITPMAPCMAGIAYWPTFL